MRMISRLTLLCGLAVSPFTCLAEGPEIRYVVTPMLENIAEAATTRVTIKLSGFGGNETIKLQMPVWSPGDYRVQSHNKYVQSVRAKDYGVHSLHFSHFQSP